MIPKGWSFSRWLPGSSKGMWASRCMPCTTLAWSICAQQDIHTGFWRLKYPPFPVNMGSRWFFLTTKFHPRNSKLEHCCMINIWPDGFRFWHAIRLDSIRWPWILVWTCPDFCGKLPVFPTKMAGVFQLGIFWSLKVWMFEEEVQHKGVKRNLG